MFKNYKGIYRLSALIAVVTFCLGLVINGCGDEGDRAISMHSDDSDVAKIILRIGCNPNVGQPGYAPASAVKYLVEMFGQSALESCGYAAADQGNHKDVIENDGSAVVYKVDDSVFTDTYTEQNGIRTMTFVTNQDGLAHFRIMYYTADNAYLGSGYASLDLEKGQVESIDNNGDSPDFVFISAADEAANGKLKVLPTEVNVGETITLTSTWVYDNVEYGAIEATYDMEENEFATLDKDKGDVTGVAGGEAPLTATYTLAEDAVVTKEVTITVNGSEPTPEPSPTDTPSPSPSVSPEPTPEPSPTESPEPSPEPSPSESPEPSPVPTSTASPSPSPSPTVFF